MKMLFLASAAALSVAAAPAIAQQADAPLGSTNSVSDKRGDFTPAQRAIYDAMDDETRAVFDTYDSDRQVMYFGWNDALRGYYWSLDDAQQEAWWGLTDVQRISLFQRELAWSDVIPGYRGETVAYTTPAARSASPATISYHSDAVVQNVPNARNGDYPICQSDADDSCMNAWAAGQRGPGVDRPLGYFPENETQRGG